VKPGNQTKAKITKEEKKRLSCCAASTKETFQSIINGNVKEWAGISVGETNRPLKNLYFQKRGL
jgi:hypothetical protein